MTFVVQYFKNFYKLLFFITYIVLHFISRLFLKSMDSDVECPTSHLHQQLEHDLDSFIRLGNKDLNWNSGKRGYSSIDQDEASRFDGTFKKFTDSKKRKAS